jgi:hypothetical protein
LKSTIENSYININPTIGKRVRKNSLPQQLSLDNGFNENESLYTKFLKNVERKKKKYFKTKLLNPMENVKCEVCGERLKIGTISLFSTQYNIGGHLNHVIDYINNQTNNKLLSKY